MKKKILLLVLSTASSVYAQLDRAGNVIESDGSDGVNLNGLIFLFIGAAAGVVFDMVRPGYGAKFCIIAGVVMGFVFEILYRAFR